MNKRTLIIIAALALPVVILSILATQTSHPKQDAARLAAANGNATPNPPHPPATLEEMRQRVRARLAVLEKMTAEQWAEVRRRNPRAPATVADAIQRNKDNLARLESMTEQQWEAQRKGNLPSLQPAPQSSVPAGNPPALAPAAGR